MARVKFYFEPKRYVIVETTEDIAKELQELNKQMWRADYAKREHESLVDSEQISRIKDDDAAVEDVLEERQLKEKIATILSTLSDEQRRIVDLKFYQDMNDTEISRELGLTRQAVQNRISKILAKLKKKF